MAAAPTGSNQKGTNSGKHRRVRSGDQRCGVPRAPSYWCGYSGKEFAFQRTAVAWEDIMNFVHVFVASTAAFLILGNGAAKAGQTINDGPGALACVNDKWDEKEVDKGHKLVDYAGRCIASPTMLQQQSQPWIA